MSKSLDRLELLATFVRIVERGSISAAARDIGVSQATASRQLAELEARIGAQLIQRSTHALSLTQAGHKALVDARAMLDAWEALAEEFHEGEGELRGGLRVIAPVALGQLALVDALLDFQQQHPCVSVNWILQDEPVRFAEAGCDLWIRVGEVADEGLFVRPLGQVERLVVAAPSVAERRPLSAPDDLAAVPCVALRPYMADSFRLHDDAGRSALIRASAGLATNNIFCAKQATLRGIGYSILPHWLVARELADGSLVDMLPAFRADALTISAAYLPSRRQTRRLRALIHHFEEAVARIEGVRQV